MSKLDNKIVLVTGASQGIGRACALRLSEEGAKVVVNYLARKDEAEKLVALIGEQGRQALAIRADVTDSRAVAQMVEEIKRAYGPVGILVNNAGAPIERKRFTAVSWGEFQKHFEVQVHGAYNTVTAVVGDMAKRRSGAIINIISTSAAGFPPSHMSGYVTAKYGLLGLTRVLVSELSQYGIRVNSVSPGFTDHTGITENLPRIYKEKIISANPLGRIAEPNDVANAVVFLASDESSFISGVDIKVSGGSFT